MKIKLDGNGELWFKRLSKMEQVYCPWYYHNRFKRFKLHETETITKNRPCGTWCSLFNISQFFFNQIIIISLCKKKYIINKKNFNNK